MSKILIVTETFHFLGQVDFRVVSGSISVNGHIFKKGEGNGEFQRAFSPRTNALMSFEYLETAEIEVKPSETGLNLLQSCQPTFNNIMTSNPEELFDLFEEFVSGFYILKPKANEFPLMRIPDEWKSVISSLSSATAPPVIFVCGHRKVGKSSFSRYLVNGLLNEYEAVDFVDLDPGQTEFTPAGFVSRKRLGKED